MSNTPQPIDPQSLFPEAARLQGIARRLLGGERDCEDLVQDAWVAALEAELSGDRSRRDPAGWRAWVGAVTRNLALRRKRREGQRAQVEREAARAESVEDGQDMVERMEWQRRLVDGIQGLEEPYRSALVLRYLDELDPREIAERQGVSYASARKRVSRALQMLRARLGVEEETASSPWAGLASLIGFRTDGSAGVPSGLALAGSGIVGTGGLVMSAKVWVGVALAVVGLTVAVQWNGDEGLAAPELGGDTPLTLAAPSEDRLPSAGADLVVAEEGTVREVVEAEERAAPTLPVTTTTLARGTVTDRELTPLEGVEIQWNDSSGAPIEDLPPFVTGEDGSFQLEQPPGGVTLFFRCANYLPEWVTSQPGLTHLQPLLFDQPMDVMLSACPRLEGLVRGPGGAPVEPPGEVRINYLDEEGEASGTSVQAEIQEGGRYRFGDLPEGTVGRIRARAKGFDELDQEGEWTLLAERTTSVDLELPPGITVVGTVRDAETGMPIPDAKVWSHEYEYDPKNSSPTTVADASGRFRLEGVSVDERNLPHGLQLVWLAGSSPDHVPAPWDPKFARQLEPGVYQLDLELTPSSCSLRLKFYEPGGVQPARAVLVWTIDSQRNMKHTVTNGDGEIELESLPPGGLKYAAFRLQRLDQEPHCAATDELELVPGDHERLEVELRRDGATELSGVITDPEGNPVAGVEVKVSYRLHFQGLSMSLDSEKTLTDEQGRYRFVGMRAGRHSVSIQQPALPRDNPVMLEWGQASRMDFLVGEGMDIQGKVELGEEGTKGLEVYLYLRHGHERQARVYLREGGGFAIEDLPATDYRLELMRDGETLDTVPVLRDLGDNVVLRVP